MPGPSGPLDPERWRTCEAYLYGIDLFNHGYYWEAHEAWEELWQACGRRGGPATFLKGLIALAATGLKARMGNARGTRTHATRAVDFFKTTTARSSKSRYMGLDLEELKRYAKEIAGHLLAGIAKENSSEPIVFEFVLRPE